MIQLSELNSGCLGITPTCGRFLAEAGAVSLESHKHTQGKKLEIRGNVASEVAIKWESPDEQTLNCWNDPEEATEFGAAGIAILLVKKFENYTVIKRSRKGTGFDYWLGKTTSPNFQDKARLEVSGIRKGNDSDIKRRTEIKLKQIEQSKDMGLPGIVVIVEFSKPIAEVRNK